MYTQYSTRLVKRSTNIEQKVTNNRRAIQKAHERFNVDLFLEELKRRHRAEYTVVCEPGFAEAIIQTRQKRSWVEVTAAYMNREYAIDEWSFATPGETHRRMPRRGIYSPDAQFTASFMVAVIRKLEKKSYEPLRDKYGAGYLVVSVQYPLFTKETLKLIETTWSNSAIRNRRCFRSIYLVTRVYDGYSILRWRSRCDS